jgi:vancomycin permeability regulator SanA
MFRRRRMLIAAGLLVAVVTLLFVPLLAIRVDTGGRLTSDPADVSHHQVALVLGAPASRPMGRPPGSWPIAWTLPSACIAWARSTDC